jgi:hypothetical protein
MSSKNSFGTVLGAIAVLIGFMALIPVLMAYYGFVVMYLFNWFIVPLGVKPISLPLAIGLQLTFQILRGKTIQSANFKSTGEAVNHLLWPAYLLAFGWILTLFL